MALAALDALDPSTAAGRAPSERYQVMVHVNGDKPAAANLHLGPALPASARRRITCDTTLRWVLEGQGRPIAVGRHRRTVDPVLRKLIEDRDQGCRVPWCQQTVGVEIHHIIHVEDGGATDPDNLMGLCAHDHDLHHRGLLGISGHPTEPNGLEFTDRWGGASTGRHPSPRERLHPTPPASSASMHSPLWRRRVRGSTDDGSRGLERARRFEVAYLRGSTIRVYAPHKGRGTAMQRLTA